MEPPGIPCMSCLNNYFVGAALEEAVDFLGWAGPPAGPQTIDFTEMELWDAVNLFGPGPAKEDGHL